MYIGNSLTSLADFDKKPPNFIIVQEESFSYAGDWYGPPDPPPRNETKIFLSIRGFSTKEEVAEWIKQERESRYSSHTPFKVFAIDAMTIKTEITVSFEK